MRAERVQEMVIRPRDCGGQAGSSGIDLALSRSLRLAGRTIRPQRAYFTEPRLWGSMTQQVTEMNTRSCDLRGRRSQEESSTTPELGARWRVGRPKPTFQS